MEKNKINNTIDSIKWDYLLVFLLIANSAIPFFFLYIEFKILNLIIVSVIFLLRKKTAEKFILLYVLVFVIVSAGQFYTFNSVVYKDFLAVIIRILIAYLTIRTVSRRFFPTFTNLIYVFALISLFFYLPSIVIPGFSNYFTSKISPILNPPFQDIQKIEFNKQIILFNFNQIDLFRNSGPFWEPGAFGGFLIIAVVINTVMKGLILEKKNVVIIIALITTLSTTNYIALFLFIMFYFILIQKKMNSFVIVLPLLAIFITLSFEFSFLQDKIFAQINEVDKYNKAGLVGNRFVSAMVDINDFLKYPIFGKGRGEINKGVHTRFNSHRSNGLASYLANFGFIFFLFYFYNLYLSFFRFCSLFGYKKYLSYAIIFLLMLIGFSEEYYNHPFFYALTMVHLIIPLKFLKYLEFENARKEFSLSSEKSDYNQTDRS